MKKTVAVLALAVLATGAFAAGTEEAAGDVHPAVILFLIFQRQFIQGMTQGGVKG